MKDQQAVEHIIQRPAQQTHQTPLLFQHGAWHGAWCWQGWLDYFAGGRFAGNDSGRRYLAHDATVVAALSGLDAERITHT